MDSYCSKCGNQLIAGANFCSNCGNKINSIDGIEPQDEISSFSEEDSTNDYTDETEDFSEEDSTEDIADETEDVSEEDSTDDYTDETEDFSEEDSTEKYDDTEEDFSDSELTSDYADAIKAFSSEIFESEASDSTKENDDEEEEEEEDNDEDNEDDNEYSYANKPNTSLSSKNYNKESYDYSNVNEFGRNEEYDIEYIKQKISHDILENTIPKEEREEESEYEYEDEDREDSENIEFPIEEFLSLMVNCQAGSFLMGSPRENKELFTKNIAKDIEEYQHKVVLTQPFKISKYLITQNQFKSIMGFNPSKFKENGLNPVECVNWKEAREFCEKLTAKYSDYIPKGYKFDLPTEAQWEYACRAGTQTPLNNGKHIITEKFLDANLNEIAWYVKNTGSPKPVGQKRPNRWGIYDMLGNVWEWCLDWYAPYQRSGNIDPSGPEYGTHRIMRGGSWLSGAWYCRSAYRSYNGPAYRVNNLGFRIVLIKPKQ